MNYNIYQPLLVTVNTAAPAVNQQATANNGTQKPQRDDMNKEATARTFVTVHRRLCICIARAAKASGIQLSQSLNFALINSRLRRAMLLSEMFLGHSAAHAPVLVQLPNPSSSILATMARARRARST